MKILCKLTGHKWDGCTCIRCSEQRDEGHRGGKWRKIGVGCCVEVCTVCGHSIGEWEPHDMEWIQQECIERCTKCGHIEEKHTFVPVDGRPCSQKCTVCGKEVTKHTWDGCVCTVCGEKNEFLHDWEYISEGDYVGIKRCRKCGERDESGKMTWEEAEAKRTEAYQNMDEGIR